MADSAQADGTSLSSATWEAELRKQVIAQLATGSIPAAATEGRFYADLTTNQLKVDTSAAILGMLSWDTGISFTPAITASTTSPTGWTTSGLYIEFGQWILSAALFTYGAGTAAVGTLRFGLPVNNDGSGFMLGRIEANDSGTAYVRHVMPSAATYVIGSTEAGVVMTGASPFTPGASDYYRVTVLYRRA